MVIVAPSNCYQCLNFIGGDVCLAFPHGIPSEILDGETEHDVIVDGQEGDYVLDRVVNA